jgi:hypothetical protein
MAPEDADKVFEMIELLTKRMKEKYNY